METQKLTEQKVMNNETQRKIISEEIDRLNTNADMQYAYGKPSVGHSMKSKAKELS